MRKKVTNPSRSRKHVWAPSPLSFDLLDARRTAEPSTPRKKELGFLGLYYLIIEPIVRHSRGTLMEAVRTKSIQPLVRLVRYMGYILRPNSFCSVCGRKVKELWRPLVSYVVDPIGVEKNLKPFDHVHIGCELCDPFFLGLNEEEKRRTSYIV